MGKLKTLVILLVVTAVAIAAAVWSQKKPDEPAQSGGLLFPGLLDRLNDTARIQVTSGGSVVTLEAVDGRWVVSEKDNYPAQETEVRDLLIGMAELERVEPKTSKPENYAKVELEDPGAEGAKSIQYVLSGSDGSTLASLVVGKRRLLSNTTDADQYFVRLPGDPQTWLVEGKVPKNRDLTDWLARDVVKIDKGRVHRVSVKHPDGKLVQVVKAKPEESDFKLLGIPAGAKVESGYNVQNIATTPAAFTLNDVFPQSEAIFEPGAGLQIVLETFDGLRVIMDTGKKGDDEVIRLRAEQDPDLPRLTGVAKRLEKAGGGAPLASADAVKAEVARLNRQWSRWAYKVPSYDLDSMRKGMDDLVKLDKPKDKADPGASKAKTG